jgi:hypothetical protein
MPTFRTSLLAVFEYFDPPELAQQMVMLAEGGDVLASNWLARLIDEGPSSRRLLDELVSAAGPIDLTITPRVEGRKLRFDYSYRDPSEAIRDQYLRITKDAAGAERAALAPRYAHAMLRIIDGKVADRIRRCDLEECGRIFFGDVRAKWCSPSCGSKVRVRIKREKDRKR